MCHLLQNIETEVPEALSTSSKLTLSAGENGNQKRCAYIGHRDSPNNPVCTGTASPSLALTARVQFLANTIPLFDIPAPISFQAFCV
jgi:hypothetical protein